MKKQIVYYLALLALSGWLHYSCTRGNSESESATEITLDIDLKSLDNVVFSEIPNIFSDIYDSRYWVANDSIVLIENSQSKGNFLDIANLNTGKRFGAFLPYGEGPDEMIFSSIKFDGYHIIAQDYIRSRFAQFTVNNLISSDFKPAFLSFPRKLRATSNPILIDDSILLINSFRYINKEYGIAQPEPRFISLDSKNPSSDYNTNNLLQTQNVGQVTAAYNLFDNHIWLASFNKSIIEIYDSTKILSKRIIVPSKVAGDPRVTILDSPGGKEVVYDGQSPSTFRNITFDIIDGSAYMLFVGEIFLKGQSREDKGAYILHFDQEGNFINGAYSPQYIRNISVSNGTIYATILDEDENPKLVKATLPDEK